MRQHVDPLEYAGDTDGIDRLPIRLGLNVLCFAGTQGGFDHRKLARLKDDVVSRQQLPVEMPELLWIPGPNPPRIKVASSAARRRGAGVHASRTVGSAERRVDQVFQAGARSPQKAVSAVISWQCLEAQFSPRQPRHGGAPPRPGEFLRLRLKII
jgi:hypothetical protein